VRSVDVGNASVNDVSDLIVGQRDGVPIYLKSVADVTLAQGPSEIRRVGQKRAAVISGDISGRDMGAVAADVRGVIGKQSLPMGVVAGLSGQEEEMQRSFRSLKRSEEHTSELQSRVDLVCRLLLEKKNRVRCKYSLV